MSSRNTKYKIRNTNIGFTLTELLVVVSIISILTAASMIGAVRVSRRAQALHIANDLLDIKQAWETWVADGGIPYQNGNDYCPGGGCPAVPECEAGEPWIRNTDLFVDDDTPFDRDQNWNGPYMDKIPADPWGTQYMYDNEEDVFDGNCPTTTPFTGANIFLPFCISGPNNRAGRYLPLAPMIDEIIDGGDGSCSGIFHWNPDPPLSNNPNGLFILMLDDNR